MKTNLTFAGAKIVQVFAVHISGVDALLSEQLALTRVGDVVRAADSYERIPVVFNAHFSTIAVRSPVIIDKAGLARGAFERATLICN